MSVLCPCIWLGNLPFLKLQILSFFKVFHIQKEDDINIILNFPCLVQKEELPCTCSVDWLNVCKHTCALIIVCSFVFYFGCLERRKKRRILCAALLLFVYLLFAFSGLKRRRITLCAALLGSIRTVTARPTIGPI